MVDITLCGYTLANVKAVITAFYLGRIPLSEDTNTAQIHEVCTLLGLKNLEMSQLTAEERKRGNSMRGFSYAPGDYLIDLPPSPQVHRERKKRPRRETRDSSESNADSPRGSSVTMPVAGNMPKNNHTDEPSRQNVSVR